MNLRRAWSQRVVTLLVFAWTWTFAVDALIAVLPPAATPDPVFLQSRAEFGATLLLSPFLINSLGREEEQSSVTLPLRFFVNGGCWALSLTLSKSSEEQPAATGGKKYNLFPNNGNNNLRRTLPQQDEYTFFAVVDTGSPFLTAPPAALDFTRPSTKYADTMEQYGEAAGGMMWRATTTKTPLLIAQGLLELSNPVIGIASSDVIQGAGGVYCGLIDKDDNRPTFLQQLGYHSLTLRLSTKNRSSLTLYKNSILKELRDSHPSTILKLVSLQSYGPDLYHYAVECQALTLRFKTTTQSSPRKGFKTLRISSDTLKRPIYVVLDTGLTGCIISDSLTEELMQSGVIKETTLKNNDIVGASVELPTMDDGGGTLELSSRLDQAYWYLLSFRLPWFHSEEDHPHIIAVGTTFWTSIDEMRTTELSIDPAAGRVRIRIET